LIAHVVLFTPRATLSASDRARFHEALTRALETIPDITAYRVGRRIRIGAAYEALAGDGYDYFAIIEFADRPRLDAYLAHPVHAELGRLFYDMSEQALAFDYEVVDERVGEALARWDRSRV
jgi:Stress responsive A/B Barrel Domain